MALSKSRVLAEAVAHWNNDFTGISELELSRRVGMSPPLVVRELRRLENRGLGRCKVVAGESAGVVFFPGAGVLEDDFKRCGEDRGRYKNLLHLGGSQIAPRYFELGVLKRYLDQQERYRVEDSVIGGSIVTSDEYYLSLPEDKRQAETIYQLEYGKRTLRSGEKAVLAILKDLAALPQREQKYWESFELAAPGFATRDPDFETFVRRVFGGEFVDDDDSLRRIHELVAAINTVFAPDKVFTNERRNPHLKYPVLNNRKSYCRAHNELWKLIGTDSLNRSLIERLLAERKECVSVADREGTLSKLKRLLASFNGAAADDVLSAFEACQTARIEDAHKVDPLKLTTEDYLKRFRQECLALVDALGRIRDLLADERYG